MAILRLVFLAGLVFLGGIAVLLGFVSALSGWQNELIQLVYTDAAGSQVTETVTRAADSERYWWLMSTTGFLPLAIGAISVAFGLRSLRQRQE